MVEDYDFRQGILLRPIVRTVGGITMALHGGREGYNSITNRVGNLGIGGKALGESLSESLNIHEGESLGYGSSSVMQGREVGN
jgi:hypothetical protein